MEILSRLKALLPFKASKKSADGWNGEWMVGGDAVGGVSPHNLLANNEEWVGIAVDKVATSLSSVRFKVMRYTRSGDDQEVFTGPLIQFLEQPAVDMTTNEFIYLNTIYKELTGNAFWEKRSGKLAPLVPTKVTPVITAGKLTHYRYTDGTEQRVIQYKDVLHDRYIDPAKPYWGKGKLSKIARWVDISQFSNEFLRRFFVNGATFGGFIETEEESEERINLIKMGILNSHTGVANSHKMGVLPKGSKYSKVTANMDEIQMGETDDRFRDKILAAFGVPKTLVGLTTEVNRASAEASEYIFAKYTIKPLADDLIAFLNIHVAPKFDNTGKFYFAYDEFVPMNMEVELKEREIALNRQPYKTVNEVRAEVGLPPVAGGDVVYGSPLMLPLGTPAASPDLPMDDNEDDEDATPPAKHLPRGVHTRIMESERGERSMDKLITTLATTLNKTLQKSEETRDLDAEAHVKFVGRVGPFKDRIGNAVRAFNNRQQGEVVSKLSQITRAVAKTDLFDQATEVNAMIDVVRPILMGLLTEQALAEYEAQGFAGTFDSGSPAISKLIDLAVKRLAKSYNNTTAELLKKALNDGLQQGMDLAALTEKINEVYDYSNIIRAEAVAKTESFYIANKASLEAYKQSGIVKSHRWYTAEDERVCPFCGPMHGRVVGVNDVFFKKGSTMIGSDGKSLTLDYRTMDVPPLHVHCRCFTRPEEIAVD